MWLGFGEAIEHWARYKPDEIALIVDETAFNFKTLYARAVDICNFLTRAHIQGRVGISVKSKFDFIACATGLHLIKKPMIFLDPCAGSEALNIHLIDTKPSAIIGDQDFLELIPSELGSGLQKIDILKIRKSRQDLLEKESCDEWGILFSSGSTGVPKAIVYNNFSMTSELLAWILELGIRRETRFYIGRPVYYTGGLVLTLATLLVGGTAILPDQGKDANFHEIWKHYQACVKKSNIDYAFFVPDQLRTFIKIANNPIGCETILVMGAPISGAEKRKVSEILKSNIIESWGNSEGLGTITEKDDLYTRPDSIGRPFLTEKIYVVADDLKKCNILERGRLAGSEETMFTEYANRPEATKRVKRKNLIMSDDIGYMDENGYFYIAGRAQEMFVVDGKTISIPEMEENARKIPDIKNVCIIVKERKEEVNFFSLVVSNNIKNNDLIKNEIGKRLKVKLSNILFVDKLPRLISGKIDRIKAGELIIKENDST